MAKKGRTNDGHHNGGTDRELLVRYLEYVLVDVAAISPASARLIELAIEQLEPSDPNAVEVSMTIN